MTNNDACRAGSELWTNEHLFFSSSPELKYVGIERILINKIQTQATQESGKKVSFKRISGPQQSGQWLGVPWTYIIQ